jgi:hypothetical protein
MPKQIGTILDCCPSILIAALRRNDGMKLADIP